jgi:hypothetical protein
VLTGIRDEFRADPVAGRPGSVPMSRPEGRLRVITAIGALVVLAWAFHELVFLHDQVRMHDELP